MCCRNPMARVSTSSIIPPFKNPTSITSLHSNFSTLRLQFPILYVVCGSRSRITCRYGGGGGGGNSRQEDSRRSQQTSFDDDPALDISTIRSNTVRLIDDQQNMVGIVSKVAAIQMAEDAELDLSSCVEYLIMMNDNLSALFPHAHLEIGGIHLDSYQFCAVVVCLVWLGVVDRIEYHPSGTALEVRSFPIAVGLIGFCYGGHSVFPNIYTSMKEPWRFPSALIISL